MREEQIVEQAPAPAGRWEPEPSSPDERSVQHPRARGFRPLALGLSVAFGLLRLLPHPSHLTPMGAVSVFRGARLPLWQALAVPLGLMAVTDLALYFGVGFGVKGGRPFDPFVYGSFLACALLRRLVAWSESPLRIGGVAVLSGVIFFLVT